MDKGISLFLNSASLRRASIFVLLATAVILGYGGECKIDDTGITTGSSHKIPDAPSGLVAVAASSTQINLSWTDNANNEDGFKLERKVAGGAYALKATLSRDGTSYYDSGLSPSTTYYYRIKAYNAKGESDWSNVASATTSAPPASAPTAPADIIATAVSAFRIDLTWSDTSNNEDGFMIERRNSGGGSYLIDTLGANTTSHSDSTVCPATTYYYRVKAYNAVGKTPSNEASATTPLTPPAPAYLVAPANSATDVSINTQLSWLAANYATSYDVYFGITSTPPYLANVTTNTYSLPTLTYSATYYWRINSKNSAGTTVGQVASFTTEAIPLPAQVGLPITPANNATDIPTNVMGFTTYVIWTPAEGAASYDVYFGTTNPPPYQTNTGIAEYQPVTLAYNTTYYWRVDSRNSSGATEGMLWLFQTQLLSSGSLVWASTNNPGSSLDELYDIAVDSTYMYLAGYDSSAGYPMRIEKRNLSDGIMVSSFGTAGVVTFSTTILEEKAYRIAIDSTYMYIIVGDWGNGQWIIQKRYLTDGNLVPAFGSGGTIYSNPSTGGEQPFGIAIDSSYMYVVGCDASPGYPNYQWRIEKRNLSDGALATSFGTAGVVTSNPSTGSDVANAIMIDTLYMYVVGTDENAGTGNFQWRIEKRNLSDGALVTSFGTVGVVTSNPSAGNDSAKMIRIDSNYMYVIGRDYSPGNDQWRIEKRNLSDGALVTSFGTVGVVISNPSSGYDEPYAIAIDSPYIYIGGYDSYFGSGNKQWRIEKRNLSDGAFVTSFGAVGVITPNPSTKNDFLNAMSVDSGYIYLAGVDRNPSDVNSQWRIEKRIK